MVSAYMSKVLDCDSQSIIAMKMQKNRHAYSFSMSMKVVFTQMNLFTTTTYYYACEFFHTSSFRHHHYCIISTYTYIRSSLLTRKNLGIFWLW